MRERPGEFALSLHPDKTRLIEFSRHAAGDRERRVWQRLRQAQPETCAFLGFTFICGKTRAGGFLIKRKTRADRMRAKLKQVKEGLRQRMRQTMAEQGRWLGQVVAGYFRYFAVPTNDRAPSAFRYPILVLRRRTLQVAIAHRETGVVDALGLAVTIASRFGRNRSNAGGGIVSQREGSCGFRGQACCVASS